MFDAIFYHIGFCGVEVGNLAGLLFFPPISKV